MSDPDEVSLYLGSVQMKAGIGILPRIVSRFRLALCILSRVTERSRGVLKDCFHVQGIELL